MPLPTTFFLAGRTISFVGLLEVNALWVDLHPSAPTNSKSAAGGCRTTPSDSGAAKTIRRIGPRRLLTNAYESLDQRGEAKLVGLLGGGDPHREVAWGAKEVVRSIYESTDPDWPPNSSTSSAPIGKIPRTPSRSTRSDAPSSDRGSGNPV